MSTTIDSKVVEMKFDNKDFEANVKNSLSTLDKLKEKLNFKGASSGLESIQKASNKMNFSGAINGAEGLSVKFSALQVAGMTAISNITTSLMSLSKNLINTFAVQPKTQGFEEYELKMGSVQTIMASTGETIGTISNYLDELNTYADKTIYSFSDMTTNIGKFTNAGVSLDKAVAAIQGISNEAALSGANTNEASRAMYNFAQALSAGYVKLIDWKSIENANMATVSFKNELIETAAELGTLEKQADGTYKVITTNGSGSSMQSTISATQNFNDSLEYQWMTTDVLVKTLNNYADETTAIGKKAYAAATEVKTFSMMMDTLKESAGSGWATTFELIFGNFTQAKALWTELTNSFDTVISSLSNARNSFLTDTMTSSWDKFKEKLDDAGVSVDDLYTKLQETGAQAGVDIKSIIGDTDDLNSSLSDAFQNGQISADLLRQTLVSMGSATDNTGTETETLNNKWQTFTDTVKKFNEANGDGAKQTEALTDAGYEYADVQSLIEKATNNASLSMNDLSDAELSAIGYTDSEISSMRNLASQASDAGSSLNELIDTMTNRSGYQLFTESITNSVHGLINLFHTVRIAWSEIFSGDGASNAAYSMLQSLNKATNTFLTWTINRSDQLKRTIKGVLAIVKTASTLVGGPLKVAIKVVCKMLELSKVDILDVTAAVGDALVSFSNWITNSKLLKDILNGVATVTLTVIQKLIDLKNAITNFVSSTKVFKTLCETIETLVDPTVTVEKKFEGLKTVLDTVVEAFSNVKQKVADAVAQFADGHPKVQEFIDVIKNLIDNISDFAEKLVPFEKIQSIFENAKSAVSDFADAWFGAPDTASKKKTVKAAIDDIVAWTKSYIASLPPIDIFSIFDNVLNQLVDIKNRFIDTMSGMFSNTDKAKQGIIDFFECIDWQKLLTLAGPLAAVFAIKKLADAFQSLSGMISALSPLATIKPVVSAISDLLKSFKGLTKAVQFSTYATGILQIAFAVGILAVAMRVIGDMDYGKMAAATTAVTVILGAMAGLCAVAAKVGDAKNAASFATLAALMGTMAVMLLALAACVAIIGNMNPEAAEQGLEAVTQVLTILLVIVAVALELGKGEHTASLGQVGLLAVALGATLVLIAAAIAIAGSLSPEGAEQGYQVVSQMLVLLTVVVAILSRASTGQLAGVAAVMLATAVAINLMVIAIALAGALDQASLEQGIAVVGVLAIFLTVMITAIASTSAQLAGVAASILAITIAIGLMVGICKLAGQLSPEEFQKGATAIGVFGAMVSAMIIAVTKFGGGEAIKAGTTIAALAIAIAALAAVAVLCGMVDTAQLAKGVIAVGILGVVMAAIMKACSGIQSGALTGAQPAIIAVAVVIAAMTVCAILLGMMDTGALIQGVAAVTIFGLVIAAIITALSKVDKVPASAIVSLAVVLTVLVAVTAILTVMSNMEVQNALPNAVALSTCLLAIVAAVKVLSTVSEVSTGAISAAAALVLIMTALVIPLTLLNGIDPVGAMANAVALSTCLLAISAAVKVLSTCGEVATSAMVAAGLLSALLLLISASLFVLKDMDPVSSLASAVALSTCLLAISAAVKVLSTCGDVSATAMAAAAVLSALLIVIAGALLILKDMDPVSTLVYAVALSTVAVALSEAAVILGKYTGDFKSGLKAVGIIVVLIGVLALVAEALANLTDGTQLEDGCEKLASLAGGLGTAIGSFVGGVFEGIASQLPEIATSLSKFITNLDPVFTKLDSLSGKDFSGVDSLCSALLKLTAADLLNNLNSFFGLFDTDWTTTFTEFAEAIAAFSDGMADVNTANLTKGVVAAQLLSTIVDAMPTEGGLKGCILGSQSEGMSNLSSSLPKLGTAAKDFGDNVKDVDPEAISNGVKAVKAMSKVLSINWPSEGGLIDLIMGNTSNSIGSFSEKLPALGEAASSFAASVKDIGDGAGIDAAVKIIRKIANLLNTDGIDKALTLSVSGVAGTYSKLGKAAANFATNISGVDFSGCDSAVSAIKGLASMIKNQFGDKFSASGVDSFVTAVNKLGETKVAELVAAFQNGSENMVLSGQTLMQGLAQGISNGSESVTVAVMGIIQTATSYFTNLSSQFITPGTSMMTGLAAGISQGSTGVTTAVTTVVTSVNQTIATLGSGFNQSGVQVMANLAAGLQTGGAGCTTAVTSVAQTMKTAITAQAGSFSTAGTSLMTSLASGIRSVSGTVVSAVTSVLSSAKNAINSAKATFRSGGSALATALANGIKSGKSSVSSAISSLLSGAESSIRSNRSGFRSAGSYCAEGLAAGIRSGKSACTAAAKEIAAAAVEAAKKEADVNSPSKKFLAIGKWCVVGFANGFSEYNDLASDAGSTLAQTVMNSTSDSLDMLSTLSDAKVSFGNASLTPVIDSSKISAYSGTLDLSAQLTKAIVDPVKSNAEILEETQRSIDASNQRVIDALTGLNSDLQGYTDSVSNMQVAMYLDGKEMASSLAKPMNKALGKLSRRGL